MREVPGRLIVLGGGPVGVEMAQAMRSLGSEVVLVEGSDHVLPREPQRLGEALGEALTADGIELRLGVHAAEVAPADGGVDVTLEDGATLHADRLMVATGRRPRTEGLGVERVGITLEHGAVPVDDACARATACGRSATSPASGR